MSTKKDQYLDSARKWVVKGQLDRAIKDYEQVIALDPTDMKHRQKLAELLVRVGRKVPAIKEYDVIGRFYAENGYYLKAIAVYKQIQKLEPEDMSVCLKLADYNNRQGLAGNAIAEYGIVLAHHQKTGNTPEAVKILEKMMEVDPENLDILGKYAEMRYGIGERDDAYKDFSRLAMLLLKRGDKAKFNRISERIRSLYPDRPEFFLNVLQAQVEAGENVRAIPPLQEMLKRDQRNKTAWQLLIRAYRAVGDTASCESALKYMIHFFPKELAAREELVELAVEQGRTEEALGLLTGHLGAFIEQRAFVPAERLCHVLLPLLGEDRLFPLLKRLYGASGDQEKLNALTDRPQAETLEVPPSVAEPEAEPTVVEPASVVAGDESDDTDDELWEDEIDLSMLEELTGEAVAEVMPGEAGAVCTVDLVAPDTVGHEPREAPGGLGLEGIVPLDWLAGPPSAGSGEDFLFSGELPDFDEFSDALDDLFKDEMPATSSGGRDRYDAEQVLAAFRQGLDEQLEPSDSDSHYDLGIAYKEMGLLDDAVKEFKRAAIGNPARLVDCLTLQGICYREKGDVDSAEEALQTAAGMEDTGADEQISAMYELALLYEATGRAGDARQLYRSVRERSPGFRDVAEKLGATAGDGDVVELEALD